VLCLKIVDFDKKLILEQKEAKMNTKNSFASQSETCF
jgi:hypothetical protein